MIHIIILSFIINSHIRVVNAEISTDIYVVQPATFPKRKKKMYESNGIIKPTAVCYNYSF